MVLDAKNNILVGGARTNNLKNINVAIPRNNLIVITGLSGSGKSTLAFDTIFAEGHHMYIESLNTYARQFLDKIERPKVDYIRGISPTIAIEQKTNTSNPKSTVGTMTEIYEYIKMLYTRIGKIYSPISGEQVKKHTKDDILNYIKLLPQSTKINILCPILNTLNKGGATKQDILNKLSKGFTRIMYEGKIFFIEEFLSGSMQDITNFSNVYLLVDRVITRNLDMARVIDSLQICLNEGEGYCILEVDGNRKVFSDKLELDGMVFTPPSLGFFSFNNVYGACPHCNGYGNILDIDENKVIPNQSLSILENAIIIYSSPSTKEWRDDIIKYYKSIKLPIDKPYKDLSFEHKNMIWNGDNKVKGINHFFKKLESQSYKIQNRVMLSRYRSKLMCKHCNGTRLRHDASYVKINNISIVDILRMPIVNLVNLFSTINITDYERSLCKIILDEITSRLAYLNNVGVGYLTLGRSTASLSGGEYQRIKLATALGSTLVDAIYILDEPTIGLHSRDTKALVSSIQKLKNSGSTVIVVEHDAEMMQVADQIIDIGPEAGYKGGEVTFQGTFEELKNANTHTSNYLSGRESIAIPKERRTWDKFIKLSGARENNLKNITATIPLNTFTVITGVSGSGKSSLVKKIIYPAICNHLKISSDETGYYDNITGDLDLIHNIELIDQNSIKRNSRSNPITYVKGYDHIRQIMASQDLSIDRGYTSSYFSFNIDGGRCDECKGDGHIRVEMQFMADSYLQCESCDGKRFKKEVLDVTFLGKNIMEILEMTVDEAADFFAGYTNLVSKLNILKAVGLGYLRLGQQCSHLSGGEAQRLKLSTYLTREKEGKHNFFIFDEPTTGLHFHDINKLINVINSLIERGNSVVFIEHNLDVIKCADWVIDLGPDGGDNGGYITFSGTPEDMLNIEDNVTALFLREKMLSQNR